MLHIKPIAWFYSQELCIFVQPTTRYLLEKNYVIVLHWTLQSVVAFLLSLPDVSSRSWAFPMNTEDFITKLYSWFYVFVFSTDENQLLFSVLESCVQFLKFIWPFVFFLQCTCTLAFPNFLNVFLPTAHSDNVL